MSEAKKLFIGVLAIQGAFKEHKIALLKCVNHNNFLANVELKVTKVSEAYHLAGLDGLVIPGGESTAIGRIIDENMIGRLSDWSKDDKHVLFGTCAGLIFLSKNLENQATRGPLKKLGIMDVTTSRNFFGRQLNSFEGCVTVKEKAVMKNTGQDSIRNAKPDVCNGVFIRAPVVVSVDGPTVKTLATLKFQDQEVIVGVQDQNCIALAFHPELTEDTRWHAYFLKLIMEKKFKT